MFVTNPRPGSNHLPQNFNDLFNKMLAKVSCEEKETILTGDFNRNYDVRNDNRDLKSIFSLFCLKQLVKTPTRITDHCQTIIVLVFSNFPCSIVSKYFLKTSAIMS